MWKKHTTCLRTNPTTCLRTNPWWRPELFSQSLYHQPGYAHHPSSSAWLCLWSVSSVCLCAHAWSVCVCVCGRAEYCWRAVALLAGVGFNWNTQWVVWVPVSRWKLYRQAHTDSLIRGTTVSWGAADYKGIHNLKYPCITFPYWLCMCVCVCVTYNCIYVPTCPLGMFCLSTLRICQIYSPAYIDMTTRLFKH